MTYQTDCMRTFRCAIGIHKGEARLQAPLNGWVRGNLRNGKLNAIYGEDRGAKLSAEMLA